MQPVPGDFPGSLSLAIPILSVPHRASSSKESISALSFFVKCFLLGYQGVFVSNVGFNTVIRSFLSPSPFFVLHHYRPDEL